MPPMRNLLCPGNAFVEKPLCAGNAYDEKPLRNGNASVN